MSCCISKKVIKDNKEHSKLSGLEAGIGTSADDAAHLKSEARIKKYLHKICYLSQ